MERNHTIPELSLRHIVRWMTLASVLLLQSCYYYAYDSDPYQDDVYYGRAAPEYHGGVDVAYGPYDNPYSQWAYLGFYGPFGYLGYFDHYHYVTGYRHFAYTPYYAYYYRGYPGFSHYYPYYRGGFNRPGVVYGHHPRHRRGEHGYRPPHDDPPYQQGPRPGGVRHANRVREDDQLPLPREGRTKGERASGVNQPGRVAGTALPLRRTQYGAAEGSANRLPGQLGGAAVPESRSEPRGRSGDNRRDGSRRQVPGRSNRSAGGGQPTAQRLPGASGRDGDFSRRSNTEPRDQQTLPPGSLNRPQLGLRVSPGTLQPAPANPTTGYSLPGVTSIPSSTPAPLQPPAQLNGPSGGALPATQQNTPRGQEQRRSGRNRDANGGRSRDNRAPRSSGRSQGERRSRDGGGRQRQQRQ